MKESTTKKSYIRRRGTRVHQEIDPTQKSLPPTLYRSHAKYTSKTFQDIVTCFEPNNKQTRMLVLDNDLGIPHVANIRT